MSVRLAVSPLLWSNDDMPRLGDATPLNQCLEEAAQAGFSGVELGRKFPRRAALLRPLLEEYGLVLASGWYGSELRRRSVKDEIAAMQEHLALLTELGAKVVVFAEVTGSVHFQRELGLSHRPHIAPEDWPRFARALSEVASYLADRGLAMAYHQHVGTVVESRDDLRRLVDLCGPAVGLTFDTGHLACAGMDPGELAQELAPRVAHVHLKDIRAAMLAGVKAHDASFLDGVVAGMFTVPGDGSVDFAPVMRALAGQGYQGWLVVEAEQDPARAMPLIYATLGYRQTCTLLAAAGLSLE